MDGATLRLALGQPDASGRLDGVLAIDLDPGWKTYWIDPGPAGLAPTFDTTGARGLTAFRFEYPAPVRFREGSVSSVGYDAPVLIPFTAQADASGAIRAEVDATIGLCRDLCVPVREHLAAEPSGSLSVRAEILAARRSLPEEAMSDAVTLSFDGTVLRARVAMAPGVHAPELFPIARDGWSLGQPGSAPTRRDEVWSFEFPAKLETPDAGRSLPPVDLVLASGTRTQSFPNVAVACDNCFSPQSTQVRP